MTASKKKGTSGETELLRRLNERGFNVVRTAPAMPYDLHQSGFEPPVRVLATRPDRGRWLFTINEEEFCKAFSVDDYLQIEVKRLARMWHHTVYEEKFK